MNKTAWWVTNWEIKSQENNLKLYGPDLRTDVQAASFPPHFPLSDTNQQWLSGKHIAH